jgi:hypothetical protein
MFIEIAVIVFYSLWIIAMLFPKLNENTQQKLKSLDIFNLIPNWLFFDPNPIEHDYYLLFRDKTGDDMGNFNFVEFDERPSIIFWLHPNARIKYTRFNILNALEKRIRNAKTIEEVITSFQYIHVLSVVMNHKPAHFTQRQFAVFKSQGSDPDVEPVLIFTSEFHGY